MLQESQVVSLMQSARKESARKESTSRVSRIDDKDNLVAYSEPQAEDKRQKIGENNVEILRTDDSPDPIIEKLRNIDIKHMKIDQEGRKRSIGGSSSFAALTKQRSMASFTSNSQHSSKQPSLSFISHASNKALRTDDLDSHHSSSHVYHPPNTNHKPDNLTQL